MAFSGQFQTNEAGTIVNTTPTFNQLVPNSNDRQDIADIIFAELKNYPNAQGTECD